MKIASMKNPFAAKMEKLKKKKGVTSDKMEEAMEPVDNKGEEVMEKAAKKTTKKRPKNMMELKAMAKAFGKG